MSATFRGGPLNPARDLGKRCKLPQRVWGGAPAEIAFGAFWHKNLTAGGPNFND